MAETSGPNPSRPPSPSQHQVNLPPGAVSTPAHLTRLCNVHGLYVSSNDPLSSPEVTRIDAFDLSKPGSLYQFCQERIDEASKIEGLIICLIEAIDPEALSSLNKEFPQIPKPLLAYIRSPRAFSRGTSLTPDWRQKSVLSFVENYVRINEPGEEGIAEPDITGYRFGSIKLQSMPLAVWTGGTVDDIPLILIIGQWTLRDIWRFVRQSGGDCGGQTRFERLRRCPEWIYHDLYSAFADWNEAWEAARDHVEDLDAEVDELLGTSDILTRMRKINKATATSIMLRESLDMHDNSLSVIVGSARRHYSKESGLFEAEFWERCDAMSSALEHYTILATGTKEQLQNLLSMMVSLEQISQGNSVARLNLLAFTFLPLSFVASIFGMTQFTISARWYPAYAIPLLASTILAALIMPKAVAWWEGWKGRSQDEAYHMHNPEDIIPDQVIRGRPVNRMPAWRGLPTNRKRAWPVTVAKPRKLEEENDSVFKYRIRSQSVGSVGSVRSTRSVRSVKSVVNVLGRAKGSEKAEGKSEKIVEGSEEILALGSPPVNMEGDAVRAASGSSTNSPKEAA